MPSINTKYQVYTCLIPDKNQPWTQYQEELQYAQKSLLIQHVTLGQNMSELSDFGEVSMT